MNPWNTGNTSLDLFFQEACLVLDSPSSDPLVHENLNSTDSTSNFKSTKTHVSSGFSDKLVERLRKADGIARRKRKKKEDDFALQMRCDVQGVLTDDSIEGIVQLIKQYTSTIHTLLNKDTSDLALGLAHDSSPSSSSSSSSSTSSSCLMTLSTGSRKMIYHNIYEIVALCDDLERVINATSHPNLDHRQKPISSSSPSPSPSPSPNSSCNSTTSVFSTASRKLASHLEQYNDEVCLPSVMLTCLTISVFFSTWCLLVIILMYKLIYIANLILFRRRCMT
jgi:hypothetical protein